MGARNAIKYCSGELGNFVKKGYAIPGISEGEGGAKVENGKYRCKAFVNSLPGEGAGDAVFLKGRR